MEKKIKIYLVGGFLFTCSLGTLLHFVYDWSGRLAVIGLFSPVSESTWEHLKLLFFPALIWSVGGSILLRRIRADLFPASIEGICAGLLSVVTFFYTYTGILGFNWLPLDILSLYLGVLVTFIITSKRLRKNNGFIPGWHIFTAVLTSILILMLFFLFTWYPPSIGLFRIPA